MMTAPKALYLRAALVLGIGTAGLAIVLPNIYANIYKTRATFGFYTCDDVVCVVWGAAEKAGIRLGDRLNVRALPVEDRYTNERPRRPPPLGRTVSFPLERNGKRYSVTLTATHNDGVEPSGADLVSYLTGKAAVIVLVVLVSALFLVRPTPLTTSLALYTMGSFSLDPIFYAFLPAFPFAALEVLTNLFFAAGVTGFIGLALGLWRPSSASLRATLITVFALLAVALTAEQILDLLGLPGTIAFAITYVGISCMLMVGSIILVATALQRKTPTSVQIAAALLAVAGAAAAFMHLYQVVIMPALADRTHGTVAFAWLTWVDAHFPIEFAAPMARWVASAAAAYVIVRDRIVDVGLVRSRIFAYGATVVAVLAAFGFVNWAFAVALTRFPYAIPLEIFTAVAIGYLFSGFRDVSSAISLAAVDAPAAAMNGRSVDEHDALARALGLAERTHKSSLIAEIRARCAFSAWVNGDDPDFEQHLAELRRVLGAKTLRGIKTFMLAATSEGSSTVQDPSDFPEWLARASLIRCARSGDSRRAGEYAQDAVCRADESDLPWPRVLARVALAESVSSERARRLNEAEAIARNVGSLSLVKSLAALRSGKQDVGILQQFVDVRMRNIRPTCPAVEIAFFTGEVKILGGTLELPDKERELLFTVAASSGLINGDLLCDALWPDSDGDAARNALYVCLHRLRKHAGDPRIVQRLNQGYALHPGTDVDLWRLEAAIAQARSGEVETLSRLLRDGEVKRATLGRWFAPFEMRLMRLLEEADRLSEVESRRA